MRMVLSQTLAALVIIIGFSAASVAGSDKVLIEDAWSRASIGTSRPGVAYMKIRNTGDVAVTLKGISTDIALKPQIHRTSTNNQGVSSMAQVGEIEIVPGETVTLEPGGLHAMLMGLQRIMKEGESFFMTLAFSDGGEVAVEIPILSIAARGPEN